jgi:hypothetical protein
MKLVLVLALAACQAKSQPPAGGSAVAPPVSGSAAAPAAAHTAEICDATLATLDRASCGSGEAGLRAARTSVVGIINAMTKVGGGDPAQYDIACARLLVALERDIGSAGCSLPIDPALRDRVTRALDAFYNQRTPVTKTGDAASDDVIAKIAAVRDATCECRTSVCVDKVDAQLTAIQALPVTAPQAARDLGSKLLDDAARCAQRARMNP